VNGNMAARSARLARSNGWHDRPIFHIASAGGPVGFTHGDVHAAAARAADVLAAAGAGAGARVLIALPDSIGLVAAFLGTLRLGALAVLAGPWQSAAEHAHVVAEADPAVVVC
jgi:fatty acid CoA ligase FadD22